MQVALICQMVSSVSVSHFTQVDFVKLHLILAPQNIVPVRMRLSVSLHQMDSTDVFAKQVIQSTLDISSTDISNYPLISKKTILDIFPILSVFQLL